MLTSTALVVALVMEVVAVLAAIMGSGSLLSLNYYPKLGTHMNLKSKGYYLVILCQRLGYFFHPNTFLRR